MADDVKEPGKITRADDVGRSKPRPTARHIVAIALIALLVLVSLLNLDDTSVDLIFRSVQLPLIVVIVVSGLVGFLVGWLVSQRREKRRQD